MIKSSLLANASKFSSIENFGADVLILTLKFKDIRQGDKITLNLPQDSTLRIDWGDGISNTSLEHTYSNNIENYSYVLIYSTYTSGNSQYGFTGKNLYWDLGKLESVDTWNTTYFNSFYAAFYNCINLLSVPNTMTANVTDMRYMFAGASPSKFNSPLNAWNVSGVTNMVGMFERASSFNQDISNWNVSGVTNMAVMFGGASSFNQDISNWNVSNVTNMSYMFSNAISFNQDISNWNVSKVTDMDKMFRNTSSFNQDIS